MSNCHLQIFNKSGLRSFWKERESQLGPEATRPRRRRRSFEFVDSFVFGILIRKGYREGKSERKGKGAFSFVCFFWFFF